MTSQILAALPGFTPTIGRLAAMLAYTREGLLHDVRDLTREQLDHLHDASSNSIGALLAHAAAVERWYQILTFEERKPTTEDEAPWLAALDLGDAGRQQIHGRELASYLEDLAVIRRGTFAELARRDDDWLDRPVPASPEMNGLWAWFHVAEDEISHRGQIRWLRARLPRVAERGSAPSRRPGPSSGVSSRPRAS